MSNTVLGIIGGSGLYKVDGLESVEEVTIDTPFGQPSDIITRAKLHGTELLFLPRHNHKHTLLPSEINYRANIFALKELGAKWCLSVTAVGSLIDAYKPGEFVVPDQVIDRTKFRESTFFGDGIVGHVAFADPYCPIFRTTLKSCFNDPVLSSETVHDGGTLVCMEGSAFSTRAESHLHKSWGAKLIGMTVMPEAKLAREAELSYASLAMVTDYDCWHSNSADVDVHAVIETLQHTSEAAKLLIPILAKKLQDVAPSDLAAKALDAAIITDFNNVPEATKNKLKPILQRYMKENS